MISFNPLFATLEKRKLTIYSLQRAGLIGGGTVDKIRANSPGVTLETINRICNYLHVKPNQIFSYTPDQTATE